MTLGETINSTIINFTDIRNAIDDLERNFMEHADKVDHHLEQPLGDIEESLAFLRTYYSITKKLSKILTEDY